MGSALIHFRPGQKERLTRRARRSGKSLSQEVRDAVEFYLNLPPAATQELEVLAAAANEAADHAIASMDDAIATVRRVLRRGRRRK